jgi:hypothetical protein
MSFDNRIEMIETIAARERENQRQRGDLEHRELMNAQQQAQEVTAQELDNPAGIWPITLRNRQDQERTAEFDQAVELEPIQRDNCDGFSY